MASSSSGTTRKKMTKLEKIAQLEGKVKILQEENIWLQKDAICVDEVEVGKEAGSTRSDDRLREALKALKRVTVKQEMSLTSLRSKARQRRVELEQKGQIIEKLQEDMNIMQTAHERLRGNGTGGEDALRARLADLELQLARQEAGTQEQSKQLLESKDDITSLRGQLEFVKGRGRVQRNPSSKSLRSTDSSHASAAEDVSKLKREIAKKTEKVANLEHDLEEARDTIHDLKQKKQFDEAFPTIPVPNNDDFFTDDEDDSFWAT